MTERRIAAPTGLSDVEAEHALQYKLLAEVEHLLAARDGRARDVAHQLHDYSEMHFASEQVIMRLHSYPAYYAHEREHGELLRVLRGLIDEIDVESGAATAVTLRRWLTAHIDHADAAFLEFMAAGGRGDDRGLTGE